jgi:hypothetical protein
VLTPSSFVLQRPWWPVVENEVGTWMPFAHPLHPAAANGPGNVGPTL